jgi:hypothetical protein
MAIINFHLVSAGDYEVALGNIGLVEYQLSSPTSVLSRGLTKNNSNVGSIFVEFIPSTN